MSHTSSKIQKNRELTMSNFKEVSPGGKPFKKLYLSFMLWFVGRAIQAATKIDKDLKEMEDRLTNGDLNAKGEKVPVSAVQLASIFGTLYDKRALIRGEPTSRVERVSVDQQLNKLHKRFEEIGKSASETEEDSHIEH